MADEHTIKNSFRAVKGDILKIEGDLLNMEKTQAKILLQLEKLTTKAKKKVIKKKSVKKKVKKKK